MELNSLLLKGIIIDKDETTSNTSITTYQRIYDWISLKDFDNVRKNNRYYVVEQLLNQLK